MNCSLGIDTSNYTTSLAVSQDGQIVHNLRKILSVAEGERGLRQSDAVFAHTVNLPELFAKLPPCRYDAVGVSFRPRDIASSYMPCFLAGVSSASAVASSLGVRLYRFSHQAGHLAAALYACRHEAWHEKRYLAFHVSGGTTEALLVDCQRVTLLGGTKDISCGKAIDRIGVKLGLSFPCGKALEALAVDAECVKPGKTCIDGYSFNLSGLENQVDRLLSSGAEPSYAASYTMATIGALLLRLSANLTEDYPGLPIVFAGGVMSNRYLQKLIGARYDACFAPPEFSCDNGAGIARLTELCHEGFLTYRPA